MSMVKIFVLFGVFTLSQSQKLFRPNLPLGEYRVAFDKIYPCESIANHPFQFNTYFSKKTLTITEVKGNITVLKPFDDNYTLDVNLAAWGSTGGWIPNSNFYIAKKACNSLKNVGGNLWNSILKSFNVPSSDCPVPVGTYTTSGLDLKVFQDHNFPKIYFYGKYKLVFKVKDEENKVLSCVAVEFNLVRPWETPI